MNFINLKSFHINKKKIIIKKMFDFIKSMDIYGDFKSNEIYSLFKTDSSELNLKLFSSLQQFHKTNEFFNYYSKQDCQNVLDIFNDLTSIISKIYEEDKNNTFKSEIDKYLTDISKIIYLLYLIQKNNELLCNLLQNTKKYLKKFYIENQNKSNLKEKIKNCINDLMIYSEIASKRNYSRRSTKENTISPINIHFGHNLGKSFQFENNTNEEEFLLFQCCTPKFEEDEDEIIEVNEEQSCFNNLNIENKSEFKDESNKKDSKKTIETIGSSLSIRHMKFVYDSDDETKRAIKKNKTVKMAINFSNPKNFFKKKSISNEINENSINNDSDSENKFNVRSIKSTKILTKFLNIISNLYKKGEINMQQKLAIKQLIIRDSDSIIEKFFQHNLSKNNDTNFKTKYIKKFLLEQIKNLKI